MTNHIGRQSDFHLESEGRCSTTRRLTRLVIFFINEDIGLPFVLMFNLTTLYLKGFIELVTHDLSRDIYQLKFQTTPQTSCAPKFVFTKIESLCTLPCSDLGTASISVVAPLACILHQSSCDNFSLLEFDDEASLCDFPSFSVDLFELIDSSERTLPMRECTLRLSWKRGRRVGRQAVKVDA
jgi:hypothetical protein